MGKIQMCRICLAENVHMYGVVNETLHDLYEKLTDNPFVTEDSRPIHACFICCAQLKKCYRFQKKCLEAEEQFAKMMNEEYEQKPLINKEHLEVFYGFIKTPISIIDVDQTETILRTEELPAVCERLDDIIEPKEEHESDDDLKTDNCVAIECTPINDSESDSEDDLTLMKVKTEEKQVVNKSKRKRKAEKTNRAPVAKKRNMETRRTKLANTSAAGPKKTDQKMIQNINPSSKTFITRKLKVQNSNNNTTVVEICRTNTNEDSKPYKCDILPNIFNQNSDLTIKKHTAVRPFKCHICSSRFKHKGNLNNHILTHTGEKPYKCDVCPSSFTVKSSLGSHMKTHIGEKPFKCDICSRRFDLKCSLIQHIRTHIAEKRFKCDICHLNFTGSSHLQKHRLVHSGEKRFKCDVCQSSFDRRYLLASHNLKHTGEKPFICDVCPSSFRVKSLLTRHIRIHTGEKPFKCEICQRTFNQRGTLTDHVRTHTREKPFKCHICSRSYGHRSDLKAHIRSHTGEKPFKCDICQSSFSIRSSLKSHIRLHTGEKPYKCDSCDRSFKQRMSLKKHVKNGLCKKDKNGDNAFTAREGT